MKQQIDVITLGVRDFDKARAFYVDGLGWNDILTVPGVVAFLQVGHSRMLSLFPRDGLSKDSGGVTFAEGTPAFSLAQSVETAEDVAAALAKVEAAGGTVTKPAQPAAWGGTHGYFTDPEGFLWEVAMNPGYVVEDDGAIRFLPPPPRP